MWDWIFDNSSILFSGVGVALIGVVFKFVPQAGSFLARLFMPHASPVRVFAPPASGYNEEFYRYFKKCFEKAKQNIYITGAGFECADEDGRQLAKNFSNMMREALGRGVNVVRIETCSNEHSDWAAELASLKETYPDKFSLYIYGAEFGSQLSSLCVIDPDSSADCVVEIMLSTTRRYGTLSADLADTAIFLSGKPDLAKGVRDRILSLIDSSSVKEALNREDVLHLVSGFIHYFAYGSNMCKKQMIRRMPSAEFENIGYLDKNDLVFNRKGSSRPGGVASVVPGKNRVWGGIWKIPAADMPRLSIFEDPSAYRRHTLPVTLKDREILNCQVYIAFPQEAHIPPEADYMKRVISGATDIGIPRDYIKFLQSIEVMEDTTSADMK